MWCYVPISDTEAEPGGMRSILHYILLAGSSCLFLIVAFLLHGNVWFLSLYGESGAVFFTHLRGIIPNREILVEFGICNV